MGTWVRRLGWIALAGLLLGVVLVAWFADRLLEGWLEGAVSARTGRTFTIGRLDVDWSLRPRLQADDVRLENARWGSRPDMARAERITARIDLPDLIEGQVRIPELAVVRPRLLLERAADGAANWRLGTEPRPDSGPPKLPAIGHLTIEDGRIRFLEPALGSAVDVYLSADSRRENAQAIRVQGSGRYRHEPFELHGRGDSLLRLFDPERGYRLFLAASAADTTARLEGRVFDPRAMTAADLDLTLELAGSDPARLYRLTGLPLPSLPPYRIAGKLVRQGGRWSLSGFDGRVGDSDLHGDIVLALDGARPVLTADLTSSLLDFDDLGPLVGAAPEAEAGETASPEQRREARARGGGDRILPTERIDLGKVRALDATVRFRAERVRTGKLPLDRLETHFVLADGRMRFAPLNFHIGAGHVATRLALDPTGERLAARMEAEVRGVDLARALEAFDVADESFGTVAGRAKLWMRGNSVAELLGSADGGLYLLMTGGRLDRMLVELAGLDAGEALATLLGDDPQQVAIECAFLDLQARRGVFTLDTAVIDSTDTLFLADGAVDLRRERMEIRLAPEPKDRSILAARSELHIQGPLKDPAVRPGAETLAKGAAAAALAAVAGPAAALLPLIEPGGGRRSSVCSGLANAAD